MKPWISNEYEQMLSTFRTDQKQATEISKHAFYTMAHSHIHVSVHQHKSKISLSKPLNLNLSLSTCNVRMSSQCQGENTRISYSKGKRKMYHLSSMDTCKNSSNTLSKLWKKLFSERISVKTYPHTTCPP